MCISLTVANRVTMETTHGYAERSSSRRLHQPFKIIIRQTQGVRRCPLYIKVGARVVYDRMDLDTWLIGEKVPNTSQQIAVAS